MEAYTQLRQVHQVLVRAQLRRYGHELADSDLEDLEQEVWLAVWMALPRFQGSSAFPTWLVGITKNVFHTWLRHKRSIELTLLRLHNLDGGQSEGTEESDPCDRLGVVEAMNSLSEPEHQVVELRYFHQQSDQEIASGLRLPLGTVKGRIRSGLLHLRQNLVCQSRGRTRLIALFLPFVAVN
jgi:RNA polymerase sigma-70 factor (ECF subfamily)